MLKLNGEINEFIRNLTNSESLEVIEIIQELWSGYGSILRLSLEGGNRSSAILKLVNLQAVNNHPHPRGWNTDISHQRKLKSYEVEWEWYSKYVSHDFHSPRTPEFIGSLEDDGYMFLLMEDLDEAGFPLRKSGLNMKEVNACLRWFAEFHAKHLGSEGKGLWQVGTYWHLATRPDEYATMTEGKLKEQAALIDETLNAAQFQTLVHGDAKVANFCFSDELDRVAAVDFQYVGRGCGMKDVVYFMSSCLSSEECFEHEEAILKHYFNTLRKKLDSTVDANTLESEWRQLYPYCWADFVRFLQGWSPGRWKLGEYADAKVRSILR